MERERRKQRYRELERKTTRERERGRKLGNVKGEKLRTMYKILEVEDRKIYWIQWRRQTWKETRGKERQMGRERRDEEKGGLERNK